MINDQFNNNAKSKNSADLNKSTTLKTTQVNEKTLMENQINKIFSVIENADSQEITKIALDTLTNKACENTNLIFMIFKNLLELVKKGNIKVIEETKMLIGGIFEEFDLKFVNKLLNSQIFRSQIENLIFENENENIFSINEDSNFESMNKFEYLNSDVLGKLELNQIENLYSNKSGDENVQSNDLGPSNSMTFNKMEMEILFPEKDEFREEVEECLKGGKDLGKKTNSTNNIKKFKRNSSSNLNKISVLNYLEINTISLETSNFLEEYNQNLILNSNKKRRIDSENLTQNSKEFNRENNSSSSHFENYISYKQILFNPMYNIIKELVKLNSNPIWRVRLCSITLLSYLQDYLDKILFSFYIIRVGYQFFYIDKINNISNTSSLEIEDISATSMIFTPEELTNRLKENMVIRLLINSVLDKVVDFNSEDYICIFKEINLKVATGLLQNKNVNRDNNQESDKMNVEVDHPPDLEEIIHSNLVKLLEKYLDSHNFNNDTNDWQNIYAILIYIKNILLNNDEKKESLKFLKIKLFDLIIKLMHIDSEEILNLTILILDKMLEKGLIIHFIEVNKISEIFVNFLKLIHKYDDIEMGVKYYFNCLFNFILYFKSKNEFEIFKQLIPTMEKEFIYFALNKIVNVRIKYFEVLTNLFDFMDPNSFSFSDQFIENNIYLAYQGLCLEEAKELLNLQRSFIEKVIKFPNGKFLPFFFNHHKTFLKLLMKENLQSNNLTHFFIPSNEKYEKKELQMLYTSFFINDMEIKNIKKNFERKISHILPLISLIIQQRIDFTKYVINFLQVELHMNKCVLSKNLLTFLKIYFYYLEGIEFSNNKIFILNDELLKKLSDLNSINEYEFPISLRRLEAENFSMYFKVFLDFITKLSSNNETTLEQIQKLQQIYTTLQEKNTINTSELLDLLKTVFESLKNPKNESNYQSLCENFKCITQLINNIDNTYTNNLKTKIRGYSAICQFIHSNYSNIKIEKVSTIANPILNFLKENSKESKIFVKYLIKLLYTVSNVETVNKILFSFIENSISIYYEETIEKSYNLNLGFNGNSNLSSKNINHNASADSNVCENISRPYLPIKYFFGEFSKFERFNDISRIINEYTSSIMGMSTNVNNFSRSSSIPIVSDKIPVTNEVKMIILINMISYVKLPTKCIKFEDFFAFLQNKEIENYNRTNPYLVKFISRIFFAWDKIFKETEEESENIEKTIKSESSSPIDKILYFIIDDINFSHSQSNFNRIHFLLLMLDQLLNSELSSKKFVIHSCNYLFDILKFINCKQEDLKTISICLFSRIMKTLSYLKMDSDYEKVLNLHKEKEKKNDLPSNSLIKSQSLVSTLRNQGGFNRINNNSIQQNLNVNLKESLRSYQITGINWLSFLGSFGLGVALCDDMGLGKTIQTLVAVVNASKEFKEKNNRSPINLIICPNTLILNWVNESKKFFYEDDVKLTRIENSSDVKLSIMKSNSKIRTQPIEIFVTSYDRIRDLQAEEIEFFYLVLDEAHIIKNPKTKLHQNIKKLNSERRIILTGTPIQNNVMELWALFDFLMPGFLGSENDFEIKYHKKIHSSIKKLNLEEKLQENIFQTSLLDIRKRVKPFIMRRLKQDVLRELPEKIIQDYMCEMTQIQRDMYTYWEKMYKGSDGETDEITNKNNSSSKKQKKKKIENSTSEKNHTLKIIDSMKKICNYPGLLLKDENMMNIPQLKKLSKDTSMLTDYYSSGKIKALEDLLMSLNFEKSQDSNIDSTNNIENKVLIFSQYKTMVDHISEFLKITFPGVKCMKITSDFSNEQRIETVNSFNSDPTINILLLTTSIGGLGLSLTSANIVIMYDHDWNPMRDLQAMDRAHRLGQKKTVEVFRLITADSIEEKLISLQTFKKYIANNVVDQTEIHETNLNLNNFMQSFEEFSQEKSTGNTKKVAVHSTRSNRKKNLDLISEELNEQEEIELEYLKKLI